MSENKHWITELNVGDTVWMVPYDSRRSRDGGYPGQVVAKGRKLIKIQRMAADRAQVFGREMVIDTTMRHGRNPRVRAEVGTGDAVYRDRAEHDYARWMARQEMAVRDAFRYLSREFTEEEITAVAAAIGLELEPKP